MKTEDLYHFDVGGNVDEGSADVSLTCLRCTWWVEWIEVGTDPDSVGVVTLADLIERGERHLHEAHSATAPNSPEVRDGE